MKADFLDPVSSLIHDFSNASHLYQTFFDLKLMQNITNSSWITKRLSFFVLMKRKFFIFKDIIEDEKLFRCKVYNILCVLNKYSSRWMFAGVILLFLMQYDQIIYWRWVKQLLLQSIRFVQQSYCRQKTHINVILFMSRKKFVHFS